MPIITSANLCCKQIHDIVNYSTFICPFESGNCGKEGKKLQKIEYIENEKSFLDEIKSIFQFLMGYHLVKKQKIEGTRFKAIDSHNFKHFKGNDMNSGYQGFSSLKNFRVHHGFAYNKSI